MVEEPSWFEATLLPQGLERLLSQSCDNNLITIRKNNSKDYQDILQEHLRPSIQQFKFKGLVMQQDKDQRYLRKSRT